MTVVAISLGSNCGNRELSISLAADWLCGILQDYRKSHTYETPCALNSQNRHYLNCVIIGKTELSISSLDRKLKEYEETHGRDSACRESGEVPVDIDIVIFDGEIIKKWDYRQRFFQIGYKELAKAEV